VNLAAYIGLPYKSKGRCLEGIDCYGLVYVFYKNILKLEVPSYVEDYASAENRQSVSEAIKDNLNNWVEVFKPKFGDMLIFNILGLPTHVGIYISNGDFIHSFLGTNTCVERLSSITWNKRLKGVYRWEPS
jgi:cell wall-associated NlpC family hydrolase